MSRNLDGVHINLCILNKKAVLSLDRVNCSIWIPSRVFFVEKQCIRLSNLVSSALEARTDFFSVCLMGKKKGEENPNPSELTEGLNLLGAPTFEKLENGWFKCVETGHELPAHARDSYANSKHCRLGLIDVALARNKPPLNMFKQDPASRSKLICRLTGDTINKREEHIWKHINGKHFLSMLDKEEAEKEAPKEKTEKQGEKKKKKAENCNWKNIDDIINEVRDSASFSSASDDEADFWMPPVTGRWDHDDGGDRWGSDSWSGPETEDYGEEDMGAEEDKHAATAEISKRTKRMSLEIGPSSFASRKKKKKTDATL